MRFIAGNVCCISGWSEPAFRCYGVVVREPIQGKRPKTALVKLFWHNGEVLCEREIATRHMTDMGDYFVRLGIAQTQKYEDTVTPSPVMVTRARRNPRSSVHLRDGTLMFRRSIGAAMRSYNGS